MQDIGETDGRKRRVRPMLIPTAVMGALALVLLAVAYRRGGGQWAEGMKAAGVMLVEILPLLAFAFVVAGMGTMVAFLTGWSLWAVGRLPMEVGILGWKFTVVRLASTFFFPPIAGWIAQTFFGSLK